MLSIDSSNTYREAISVAIDNSPRIWKPFDRFRKALTMPRRGGIEKKRTWMTEISFGDQICEDRDLMTWPPETPGDRE
jgi:hypothetical protein